MIARGRLKASSPSTHLGPMSGKTRSPWPHYDNCFVTTPTTPPLDSSLLSPPWLCHRAEWEASERPKAHEVLWASLSEWGPFTPFNDRLQHLLGLPSKAWVSGVPQEVKKTSLFLYTQEAFVHLGSSTISWNTDTVQDINFANFDVTCLSKFFESLGFNLSE